MKSAQTRSQSGSDTTLGPMSQQNRCHILSTGKAFAACNTMTWHTWCKTKSDQTDWWCVVLAAADLGTKELSQAVLKRHAETLGYADMSSSHQENENA